VALLCEYADDGPKWQMVALQTFLASRGLEARRAKKAPRQPRQLTGGRPGCPLSERPQNSSDGGGYACGGVPPRAHPQLQDGINLKDVPAQRHVLLRLD
jgi:hypothetical protein